MQISQIVIYIEQFITRFVILGNAETQIDICSFTEARTFISLWARAFTKYTFKDVEFFLYILWLRLHLQSNVNFTYLVTLIYSQGPEANPRPSVFLETSSSIIN